MSISVDNLFTNALEKALAPDENDTQTLVGRSIAEAVRLFAGRASVAGSQAAGTDASVFVHDSAPACWGLNVVSITNSPHVINLGPGLLVHNQGAESPTADDSSYRVGLQPAATAAVTVPAADDKYHLLECRIVNTQVTDTRDILLDPNTDDTAPTVVVKRNLKRLAFQIITGTATAIPTPTAGFTPLYGFFLSTGAPNGLPLMAEIVDMRPIYAPPTPHTHNPASGFWYSPVNVLSHSAAREPGVTPSVFSFQFEATIDGRHLWASSVSPVPPTAFFESGTTMGAQKVLYWYLAPLPPAWGGGYVGNWAARVAGGPPVAGNCIVVVSQVAPVLDGRNNATMTLGAPFGGVTIPANAAVCVGPLVCTFGGTEFDDQYTSRSGIMRMASGPFFAFGPNLPAAGGTFSITASQLPQGVARHFIWDFFMNVATATQVTANSRIRVNGTGAVGGKSMLINPKISGIPQELVLPAENGNVDASQFYSTVLGGTTYDFAVDYRDEFNTGAVTPGNVVDVSAQLGVRLRGLVL